MPIPGVVIAIAGAAIAALATATGRRESARVGSTPVSGSYPHFPVSEFGLTSRTRRHYKTGEKRYFPDAPYPSEWVESRLNPLREALEILRAELGGRPVTILSAYRPLDYNRWIGSSDGSQHVQGTAADIAVSGVPASTVHAAALRLYREGRIKIGGLGRYNNFTHIDVRQSSRLAQWDKALANDEVNA